MTEENNNIIKNDNPLDDIIMIKENGESEQDILLVAMVRHLMRPFLTIVFSLLYCFVVVFGAYLVLQGKGDWKDVLIAVEAVALPIIGYHFGKSSAIDKK